MTMKLLDVPVSVKPRQAPVAPGGESDDWYTPLKVFAPLHAEMKFTVDAAGAADAPVSKLIGRWHDIEEDGLAQEYDGDRVWCNPPYSDIAPWVERGMLAVLMGEAELWAMLLPSWTDRAWWHDFIEPHRIEESPIEVDLLFIRGRVRFGFPGNPEGRGNHGGGFDPSVIVIFRRKEST